MPAQLARFVRRLSRVLALVWALPVGLLMLWTCAVLANGLPLWRHPVFLAWLAIGLALAAIFTAAAALVRRLERR